MLAWQQLPLLERIRWLRYTLPPILAFLVIGYQLGIARTPEESYGYLTHYQEIGQQAPQIIHEVRRPIFALRPLDWSRAGFLQTLRRFIDDFPKTLSREEMVAALAYIKIFWGPEELEFQIEVTTVLLFATNPGPGSMLWSQVHA